MTAISLNNLPRSKCGHLEFLLLTTSPFIFNDFTFIKTDPVSPVPEHLNLKYDANVALSRSALTSRCFQ